ncbi:hypothetical protein CLPU_3c00750 [Gottschalkia purinilytica]|uniref:Uncharacterized protein n=1 Tax=Gottschalkia purinilytica TaxID=1503 RepID=A0A0L0WCV3_GOTPU|nr:hypothetical protein [Gottschalkia purinilytica]KNF09297.1 hypothetical protein CLPU_3c00750 [Gottschalkia purinilytica]
MQKSYFFNSVNGDRQTDARHFTEFFSFLLTNGVLSKPEGNLKVVANDGMNVTLSVGRGIVKGHFYINTEKEIFLIDHADGLLNRIDRLVLRLDEESREVKAHIKKGNFSENPVPPSVTRNDYIHELVLADIYIRKGAISVRQSDITDTRLNSELCGIVNSLIQVDTTMLFEQYVAWFQEATGRHEFEAQELLRDFQRNFNAWFENVKGILDEDVAGNLYNEIEKLQQDINSKVSHADFISTVDNLNRDIRQVESKTEAIGTKIETPLFTQYGRITQSHALRWGLNSRFNGVDSTPDGNYVYHVWKLKEGEVYIERRNIQTGLTETLVHNPSQSNLGFTNGIACDNSNLYIGNNQSLYVYSYPNANKEITRVNAFSTNVIIEDITVDNDYIYVVGTPASSTNKVNFIKMNKNGVVVFERYLNFGFTEMIRGIVSFKNELYILIGPGARELYKIDSNGSLLTMYSLTHLLPTQYLMKVGKRYNNLLFCSAFSYDSSIFEIEHANLSFYGIRNTNI